MKGSRGYSRKERRNPTPAKMLRKQQRKRTNSSRPREAYRQRSLTENKHSSFVAPEVWHEATGRENVEIVLDDPGFSYVHPVTEDEVRLRIEELPAKYLQDLEVVHLSRVTQKKALFPCYGMQWGVTVYLYPIEESLSETYVRPPRPQQIIEAKMYGGVWSQAGNEWKLEWTPETIRDYYLNNILIHEIGHINDTRNTSYTDRERYANWFAQEYGFRHSRGLR